MESSVEHTCPNCSAPAQARQRWCLECGAEVSPRRRGGLRSAIGIATALAVLVGAGSAAGYTLLQDGKKPPPPATTVAQQPPATIPPAATQEPAPYTPPSSYTPYTPPSTSGTNLTGTSSTSSTSGGAEDGAGTTGNGSVTDNGSGTGGGAGTTSGGTGDPETIEPQMTLTDIALGAVAVVYAPYASGDADLGDASRVVDGTTRTAWKTPAAADPTSSPQIGVYVDLAGREEIRKLVVRTPTPGIAIEVYGARKGPPPTIVDEGWDHLSTRADLPAEAKIKLPARPYRYILVWITALPPDGARAAISELSLLSLQPE